MISVVHFKKTNTGEESHITNFHKQVPSWTVIQIQKSTEMHSLSMKESSI
jgi:hypothetical protein